ncbi:hypothetical protein SK128_018157 [Halocaridina rubra]|uniref:Uncharacterized protein n=1 Tax=Halocaridina rubra TaxID=373956 RepID=A0AAN9AG18_HALRR
MIEGGLITKWADEELTKVAGKSKNTDEGSGRGAVVITVKHLQAAFFILVMGYLLGGGVVILESIYFRARFLAWAKFFN